MVDFLEIKPKTEYSDSRDRLYRIRDLLKTSERNLIVPDYSNSVQTAFRDLFLRAYEAKERGEPLALSSMQDTPSKLRLPSWSL